MATEAIAVVGAGRMGTAIAWVLAAAGHEVRLQDPDPGARRRAEPEAARISALRQEPLPLVQICAELAAAVTDAGWVIEAAPESRELKREIFAQLSGLTAADAVLATNTSAIPVRDLADAVERPERVVGTHFWNPPYAVSLVEVVEAPRTAGQVVDRVSELLRAAGLHPVDVKRDVPGFVGNRLQHALKREAIALVADGVCDAETVDTVVKLGFGARLAALGPLEQSDLVGLDLTLAIHRTLMPHLDVTPVPHPLLVEKVERGELGAESGRGFREWTPEQARAARERLDALLLEKRA